MGFSGGTSGKEPACTAGDMRDQGSIPGSGRPPKKATAAHASTLVRRIPCTEEPGGHRAQRHDWRGFARWSTRASLMAQRRSSPHSAGGQGSILGQVRKVPGEGDGNPLQYSCLENPMDRGAWWATVHGVTKESDRTEWIHTRCTRRLLCQFRRLSRKPSETSRA